MRAGGGGKGKPKRDNPKREEGSYKFKNHLFWVVPKVTKREKSNPRKGGGEMWGRGHQNRPGGKREKRAHLESS